jgi:hypothetical protein
MRIHVGCKLTFDFPQLTLMIACLNVHFSRFPDLERPDHLVTDPPVPIEGYRDGFGNWCSRLVAPAGRFTLGTDAVIRDVAGRTLKLSPKIDEASIGNATRCHASSAPVTKRNVHDYGHS